jgi:hypothetical protein
MFLARTFYDIQGATVHARYALRCRAIRNMSSQIRSL